MPEADKPSINYKRRGSRYRARRRAVDILFEAEARDIDPVAILEDRITLSRSHESGVAPINPYTKQIVAGAAEELDRIDEVITAHLAEDWTLERISAVDRAVLRVAVWELLFNEEVPVVTAVVEAVELSSEYSTDDSPAYINALLDAVVQKIDDARAGVPFILPEPEVEVGSEDLDDEGLGTEVADDESLTDVSESDSGEASDVEAVDVTAVESHSELPDTEIEDQRMTDEEDAVAESSIDVTASDQPDEAVSFDAVSFDATASVEDHGESGSESEAQ